MITLRWNNRKVLSLGTQSWELLTHAFGCTLNKILQWEELYKDFCQFLALQLKASCVHCYHKVINLTKPLFIRNAECLCVNLIWSFFQNNFRLSRHPDFNPTSLNVKMKWNTILWLLWQSCVYNSRKEDFWIKNNLFCFSNVWVLLSCNEGERERERNLTMASSSRQISA